MKPMSNLLKILLLLYKMLDDDIKQLSDDLLIVRKRVYTQTLTDEARRVGCNRTGSAPRKSQLRDLRRMCDADARQIAKTYNRDVERNLKRLYAANPRGNRRYYAKNMRTYLEKRSSWKTVQIAMNTETTTRAYAQQQFRNNNRIQAFYVFAGPAPICDDCSRLYAMGLVTQAVVDVNPAPVHINCTHQWQARPTQQVRCEDLWIG
jgi:hypothetical protein